MEWRLHSYRFTTLVVRNEGKRWWEFWKKRWLDTGEPITLVCESRIVDGGWETRVFSIEGHKALDLKPKL